MRNPRSPLLGTLAVALAAVLAWTMQTGTVLAETQSVVSRGVTIPDFYNPPASLPAANGAIVRTEPLPLGLSLPGLDGRPLPGTATRLMYKSTDSNGQAVAVTGAYIEPSARWSGSGPRPLVAFASGTMGQGDQCASSYALQYPATLTGDTVSVAYEVLAIYRLLSTGSAVVVTDYVGLGTTDRLHTYVNRLDQAHALLDAARAARAVPGASITTDSKVGLYGYSQGGGASAAAVELQSSYASDVNVVGAHAGAPPADLTAVVKGIEGSALAGALGWSINGFAQAEPALQRLVDEHINAAGKAALQDLSTMCVGDAVFGYAFTSSRRWSVSGRSLSEILASVPEAQAVLDEQRIGTLKPIAPVRVVTGIQDDIVPHAQSRQLAVDWCRKGANVTYVPVILPNLGDKILLNHLAPALTDQGSSINWLTNRLKGRTAFSNCVTMPIQP